MKFIFEMNEFLVEVDLSQEFLDMAKYFKNLNAEVLVVAKDFKDMNLLYGRIIFKEKGFYFTGLTPTGVIIKTPTTLYEEIV